MQLSVAPLAPSAVPRSLLDEADTLTGALAALAGGFPDFECLIVLDRDGRERRVSLGSIWARAQAFQAWLQTREVRRGAIVLMILPTSPDLAAAYFGTMLAGAVPGLLAGPTHRLADQSAYAAHVRRIVDNAGAAWVCCSAEVAEILRGPGGLAASTLFTPEDVADGAAPGAIAMPAADDLATVQYSSGSTGTPKGVLLSHRAMLNNIRAVRDGLALTARDVSVNWIPLYHDMGLIDAFLLPLLVGCPTVLIPTADFMREPALWLWAMHHYRGTISWAPNFAYTLCATRVSGADVAGLDLAAWRVAINAAEPVLPRTIEEFTRRFAPHGFAPAAMTPAWGLAENVTIATSHPVGRAPRVESIDRRVLASDGIAQPTAEAAAGLASVAIGRCLPHCEIEIRDDAGRALAERRIGTVWLRSNSLFSAYNRDPELTARVRVDGWLDTGDRGYLADADLFFIARSKDLIIIGGEKYAPHDLETVINRVPGVREGCAVVFGVLNERRGTEDVAAVAETRETDPQALAALREAIRQAVTHATGLGLRHVLLVPPGGVQKTTSGKLARSATRARYADRLDATG